jgi:hypothetical protein
MTGCPWQLVYSASQTFDRLRAESRVNYRSGLLAVRVEEDDHGAVVIAQELESGRLERLTADRVFLACGAVGTTRLVAGSLRLFDQSIDVQESSQFTLPFVSRALMQDPRQRQDFTLNQFNMVLRLDDVGRDLSQIHFYTYNSAFLQALPAVVNRKGFGFVQSQLLRRLSVGIGYLPSWASPPFQLTVSRPADPNQLAPAQLTAGPQGFARNKMLRQVLLKVSAAAPALDLWPVLPAISFAASGKSYHVGATFPHRREPCGRLTSDVLGRVDPWRRIHLVDASVFPDVPATTFTLTIMANAHRIAHDSLAERA